MKINLLKGLDRLSLVLCIPIAIYGFFFVRDEYTYRRAVDVVRTKDMMALAKKQVQPQAKDIQYSQGDSDIIAYFEKELFVSACCWANEDGIIASGKQGLKEFCDSDRSPLFKIQLQNALQRGADPDGDWIFKELFGLKERIRQEGSNLDTTLDEPNPTCIVPSKSQRIIAGTVGALLFYMLPLVTIALISRLGRALIRLFKRYGRTMLSPFKRYYKWVFEGFNAQK